MAPQYLAELLHPYTVTAYALRSSNKNLREQPTARTKTYGDRAFTYAAPKLWNTLPLQIRSIDTLDNFKTAIKTFLFQTAYSRS